MNDPKLTTKPIFVSMIKECLSHMLGLTWRSSILVSDITFHNT